MFGFLKLQIVPVFHILCGLSDSVFLRLIRSFSVYVRTADSKSGSEMVPLLSAESEAFGS